MFKLAIIQCDVTDCKEKNIMNAISLIEEASRNGANVISLPEIFNSPYDNSCFKKYSEIFPGETSRAMMEISRKCEIYLIAGSIPENEGGKIYNTSYVFNPKGEMIGRHRKVHLFDINVEGGQYFMESDVLTQGNDFTIVDTEYGKIGVGICFDVRFPEYFRILSNMGAKLVILPAAFNMTTGPLHWEISLRMRAVDNQFYMAASSPARNVNSSYVSYAHSMIVDPWGKVLEDAGINQNIIYADIDFNEVDKVRNQLPLLKNRRQDLYETLKKINKESNV